MKNMTDKITELKDMNSKFKLEDFNNLPYEVRKKAFEDLEIIYNDYLQKTEDWKANQNANK